jgi:hypothetical protein
MGRTLDQVMAKLPAARRRKIDARVAEIVAEEMSLQDLRKAMSRTQVSLAKQLGVGQDSISRLERRADMLLSTLSAHVEALGGSLHLVAELPDRPPVRISDLGIIVAQRVPKRRPRAAAARRKA